VHQAFHQLKLLFKLRQLLSLFFNRFFGCLALLDLRFDTYPLFVELLDLLLKSLAVVIKSPTRRHNKHEQNDHKRIDLEAALFCWQQVYLDCHCLPPGEGFG